MPPKLTRTLEDLGLRSAPDEFDRLAARLGGLVAVRELLVHPESVLETSDMAPGGIRQWLRALPIAADEQVRVGWPGDRAAACMPFTVFVERYDDFWYPAMDDVVVMIEEPRTIAVIVLDHEEHFAFGRLTTPVSTDKATR
ncbi:hypothetical protein ACIA8O_15340 [Kitasatospora sp. NPDC051853]|uniref:hypothetical protein n=1 Tax=Kitasatospora sp. NPDC051853 TaxID=3364058 RepID=UPI00379737F9